MQVEPSDLEVGKPGELSELYRRLSRAIERGRSLQLSARELDILTAVGVYDVISKAAADELKALAVQRIAARSRDKEG